MDDQDYNAGVEVVKLNVKIAQLEERLHRLEMLVGMLEQIKLDKFDMKKRNVTHEYGIDKPLVNIHNFGGLIIVSGLRKPFFSFWQHTLFTTFPSQL